MKPATLNNKINGRIDSKIQVPAARRCNLSDVSSLPETNNFRMKASSIIIKILTIFIILISNSCIENYKISTKVNIDGSLERTIQIIATDSASVFEGNLKIPVDTSWTISTRWFYEIDGDTTSEKKFEYTASRHFKDTAELNKYLKIESDTSAQINIETSFDKKFRWFYSYINYKETYRKSLPFEYYKPEDFLSKNELSYFYDDEFIYVREYDSLVHIKNLKEIPQLTHEDSVRMECLENTIYMKLSDFLGRNIYEELYNYLVSNLELLDKSKHTYLVENKDSIYIDSHMGQLFTDLSADDNSDPIVKIAAIIGLSEDSIKKLDPISFKLLETKIGNTANLFLAEVVIKNSIAMPGLLLKTNADSIDAGKSFWNYNEHYFFLNDYKLFAESRIINKWAFVVSGFVIISLLYLIFAGIKRK